jgi:LmbE family N-acetylglucosaminyl deacetylase
MSHRPNDYHPDHRYTGVLVQDAAYMVAVPKLLPEVPALKRNPVFLYYSDHFKKPNPFKPDVVVALDAIESKKLAALERIVSQFYEGGATGSAADVPDDPKAQENRRTVVRNALLGRDRATAKQYRDKLAEFYGKDPSGKVEFAEAFEVCEYGRQPDAAELRRLFPFFDR